jgi:two-component system, sensor histidine kinase PdtaS
MSDSGNSSWWLAMLSMVEMPDLRKAVNDNNDVPTLEQVRSAVDRPVARLGCRRPSWRGAEKSPPQMLRNRSVVASYPLETAFGLAFSTRRERLEGRTMSYTSLPPLAILNFPWRGRRNTRALERGDPPNAELRASIAREEEALRKKYGELLQRQRRQLQEFEHRVFNGLQLVASMLVLQSLRATPETAAQLSIAAGRVAAVGRVHKRLHSLDGQDYVEFKEYLQHLCADLSSLLFEEQAGSAIVVQCANFTLPAALGIPLGLIVNELVTNSAKHAKGNITVRVETTSPPSHSLSVSDDGPGLSAVFNPAKSEGLGMRIVLSLVKEIGGELHVFPGDNGRGTRFTVTFRSSENKADVLESFGREQRRA